MGVNGHATEDGILETEDWETVLPGPGHDPLTPHSVTRWDRVSGVVERVEDEAIITIHPPERPY